MDNVRPLPVLRGRLTWLRPSERSDIDLFVRWFNDAETLQYLSMRAPMGRALEERWFDRMLEAEGREGYHFVMCRREDDLPFGTIGFFAIDRDNGSAELGISIGEKALWNQGLGTDAMEVLLDYGFGELRLERIALDVYDYNQRARHVYEKVGFTLEGTRRRATYRHGAYHDVHSMAILRDEWLALDRPRSWELP